MSHAKEESNNLEAFCLAAESGDENKLRLFKENFKGDLFQGRKKDGCNLAHLAVQYARYDLLKWVSERDEKNILVQSVDGHGLSVFDRIKFCREVPKEEFSKVVDFLLGLVIKIGASEYEVNILRQVRNVINTIQGNLISLDKVNWNEQPGTLVNHARTDNPWPSISDSVT